MLKKVTSLLKRILKSKKFYITIFIIYLLYNLLFTFEDKTIYITENASKGDIKESIKLTTNIKPNNYAEIKLPSANEIRDVYVKIGDTVSSGQMLVQLDDSTEQSQLASANSSLSSAYSALYSTQNAQYSINQANAELKNSTEEAYKNLVETIEEDETISESSKEILINALDLTYISFGSFTNTLQSAVSSISSISGGASQISLAQAQVDTYKNAVDSKKIKSPINGVVYFISRDKFSESSSNSLDLSSLSSMSLAGGSVPSTTSSSSSVSSGQQFNPEAGNSVIIIDKSSYYLINKIALDTYLKISKDTKVNISVKYTDITLTGKIEDIYAVPDNIDSNNPLYFVKVRVEKGEELNLPIGVLAEVEYIIGESTDTLKIPVNAVINVSKGDEQEVFVINNKGEKEVRKVKVGLQNTDSVEIKEGLNEGDKVVVDTDGTYKVIAIKEWIRNIGKK